MTDTMDKTYVDVVAEHVGPLAIRGDRWAGQVMARLALAEDQEAEAQQICQELADLTGRLFRLLSPYVKAALADRRVRAMQVLHELGIADEQVAGEHAEDIPRPWQPDRFMLIEEQHRGLTDYYLTTWPSVEAAGEYHHGQEYCADYSIEVIVDLDSGDRYEVEQVFIARKLSR